MSVQEQRTYIMLKPDGVARGLVGKVIQRFEERGFKLVALKLTSPSKVPFLQIILNFNQIFPKKIKTFNFENDKNSQFSKNFSNSFKKHLNSFIPLNFPRNSWKLTTLT
jgi:nucleoside diphosphate kinase